jgi:hypothetical protein
MKTKCKIEAAALSLYLKRVAACSPFKLSVFFSLFGVGGIIISFCSFPILFPIATLLTLFFHFFYKAGKISVIFYQFLCRIKIA